VCGGERERQRECVCVIERVCERVCVRVRVRERVCVCVKEGQRKGGRERERSRERDDVCVKSAQTLIRILFQSIRIRVCDGVFFKIKKKESDTLSEHPYQVQFGVHVTKFVLI